jgi:hypothetical protein
VGVAEHLEGRVLSLAVEALVGHLEYRRWLLAAAADNIGHIAAVVVVAMPGILES